MSSPSTPHRPDRAPPNGTRRGVRALRWIAVLLVVALLHWIAAQWVERNRVNLNPSDEAHVPVQVALLTPERIERNPAAAPATPAPAAAPHPAATARPRETVLSATRPAANVPANVPAMNAASDAAASAAVAAANAASTARASNAANAGAPTAASAAHASSGVKFSVPPSGELQYDTFYNGVRNQPGTIHWTSNAQGYEMVVSVPLPFVGTFVYSSHGHIDAFGLAPEQYIEKRGRRAEDIAIFNRADKKIGFTRTPTTLPLADGAQDRFSVVMQLASLVRGDPSAYKPGVTREFLVVDSDSGENWPVETIGDETIRTAQGYLDTRHFKRLPRHDGDMRRVDVWLAPSLGWLPARIVQTEPNGTQFELVWRGKLDAENVDNSAASVGNNDATSPQNQQNANSAVHAAPPSNGPAPSMSPESTAPADTPGITRP